MPDGGGQSTGGLGKGLNRIYDRTRHGRAQESVTAHAVAGDFEQLHGHKYCLLTTFRRSGEGVPTPVWFGIDDGKLYVRTGADTAKVRRIRNNGTARVAPSTLRGKPLGPPIAASARVLPREEEDRAERALTANYGIERKLYERFLGGSEESAAYIEVSPAIPSTNPPKA
jgi:uncharacterized protein